MAVAICAAAHGTGAYEASQQVFNADLGACRAIPPTATDTPIPTKPPRQLVPKFRPAPQSRRQRLPPADDREIADVWPSNTAPGALVITWPPPRRTPRDYRVSWADIERDATTDTIVLPTDTAVPPTSTPIPPTDAAVQPTNTPIPATATSMPPTNTAVPPTNTATPTLGPREKGSVILQGDPSGAFTMTWQTPREAPVDNRINWARESEGYPTWTDLSANAFALFNIDTVTGLQTDVCYKFRLRALRRQRR